MQSNSGTKSVPRSCREAFSSLDIKGKQEQGAIAAGIIKQKVKRKKPQPWHTCIIHAYRVQHHKKHAGSGTRHHAANMLPARK
jgi:hypothetical protein